MCVCVVCVKLFTYISLVFVKLKINNPAIDGPGGPNVLFRSTYKLFLSNAVLVNCAKIANSSFFIMNSF